MTAAAERGRSDKEIDMGNREDCYSLEKPLSLNQAAKNDVLESMHIG